MKNFLRLLLILAACCALPAKAQVINAASCSSTDVQTALSAVTSSTTTVNIPACSGGTAWTAPVSVTLPSTGNLVIQGTTTITGNCSPSSPSCTATDGTVIVDNYASTNPLLTIVTQSGCTETRITGITFKGGTGLVKQTGMVAINGTCHSVRVDHNHLLLNTSSLANIGVRYTGWVYGVMDHNLGDMTTATTSEFENTWTQGYGGGTMGEVAWSSPSALGTAAFMYLENNVINNGLYANDCDFGGRSVVRYNVLNNVQLQTHPTGSAPDAVRGCRAQEIYQNQLNGLSACNGTSGFGSCLYNGVFISSGTGVLWGNSFPLTSSSGTSSGYQWVFSIQSMRITNSTYSQVATPNGWGYCGNSSGLSGDSSLWDGNTTSGYPCLDQPGRGQGDLLSGDFPSTVNSTTGTIAWPHQALEPYYEWLDTQTPIPSNPSGIVTNSSTSVLSANTDYYTYNASFTGASGTGSGLLSARPSTCTAGVAYWATDTSILYQCGAGNTWTTYYAPYTYPHPLISGSVTLTSITVLPNPGAATVGGTVNMQTNSFCTFSDSSTVAAGVSGCVVVWTTTGAHSSINSSTGIVTGSSAGSDTVTATLSPASPGTATVNITNPSTIGSQGSFGTKGSLGVIFTH